MAVSLTTIVSILILLVAVFSMKIIIRDIQIFSKAPRANGNNNIIVAAAVPNKEEQSLSKQQQSFGKQQQKPTIVLETRIGNGLYGQENNQLPTSPITSTASGSLEAYTTPTTTSTDVVKYEPYATPITSTGSGNFEPYNTPTKNTVNYEPYTTRTTSTASTYAPYTTKTQTSESCKDRNNYYNKNAFETEQENQGDSKFQQSGYTNVAKKNSFYNGGNNNVEKQGMSDTRFMENGKYYYNVQSGQNYNPNQYHQNSREVASGNGFNSSRGYEANNENSYEYNKPMEGYQNEKNEFDELQN